VASYPASFPSAASCATERLLKLSSIAPGSAVAARKAIPALLQILRDIALAWPLLSVYLPLLNDVQMTQLAVRSIKILLVMVLWKRTIFDSFNKNEAARKRESVSMINAKTKIRN
jgi:hypothetical protein